MTRIIKRVLSGLFLTAIFGATAQAATHTAATCNRSDVNAVINGPTHTAVDGDVINIPAGSCTWASGISVPAGIGITIIGAGTTDPHNPSGSGSTTTIIDNATVGGNLFYFHPSYGASLSRISSMYLSPQSGLSSNSLGAPIGFQGTCTSSGCPDVRMDHIVFPGSPSWGGLTAPSSTMVVTDNVFGVLDHNSLYQSSGTIYEFVNVNHSSWQGVGQNGDSSWSAATNCGSSQALYVESNYFEETGNAALFPITETEGGFSYTNEGGGRFVVRFNTAVGLRTLAPNHGTESNGRPRGGRLMEVYKNSLSCPSRSYPACYNNNMLQGAAPRSGSVLALANNYTWVTGTGINTFLYLVNYRILTQFSVWGACDGTGLWDSNDGTVYASGTFTSVTTSGSNITVTDSTKSWSANQWLQNGSPYSIHDVTTGDGSEITGNGTNTLSVTGWSGPPNFKQGNSYQIRRSIACIDQSGRSGGSLLSGDPPTPNNSSQGYRYQTLDPVYEAAETGSGNPAFGIAGSDTAKIIANRDYYAEVSQSAQSSPTSPFNGTAGTGYGTVANRPRTCTPRVGYWATDQGNWNHSHSGGQGQLYVCTATNTWTLYYTPYTYPHPLTGNTPAAPTNLQAFPH